MWSDEFLDERIEKTKALIRAYEDAALALASTGGIQSYTFDSGQSRQVATRYSAAEINKTLDVLMNRLASLQARRNGSGVVLGVPAW